MAEDTAAPALELSAAPVDAALEAPPTRAPDADSASDRVKELQDRLSAMGRESAAERRERERMQAELMATRATAQNAAQQLAMMAQRQQQAEYQAWEQRLQELAPAERAEQIARYSLWQQQQAQQQRQAAPPPTYTVDPRRDSDAEVDTERHIAQELAAVNTAHGLGGEQALNREALRRLLTLEDWETREAFDVAVRREAEKRAMAKKTAPDADTKDRDAIKAEVMKELRAEMGIGRPNSPRAAAPAAAPDAAAIQSTVQKPINRQGPRASIQELQTQKAAALEKLRASS